MKKKCKLKTFRVGYTFHGFRDVRAKNYKEAEQKIGEMDNDEILENCEFDIDYSEELSDNYAKIK